MTKELKECYTLEELINYFIEVNALNPVKILGNNYQGFHFIRQIYSYLLYQGFDIGHPCGEKVIENSELFNLLNEIVRELFDPKTESHILKITGPKQNIPVYRRETKTFRFEYGMFFHCMYIKDELKNGEEWQLLTLNNQIFDLKLIHSMYFNESIVHLFENNLVYSHGLVFNIINEPPAVVRLEVL